MTTEAFYQSAGLYKAIEVPKVAGKYLVSVLISNSYTAAYPTISGNIKGSPFIVTIDLTKPADPTDST